MNHPKVEAVWMEKIVLLLMEGILSHYVQGFLHTKWCRFFHQQYHGVSVSVSSFLSCLCPIHLSSTQPSVICHVMVWTPPADQSFFPPEKILVEN